MADLDVKEDSDQPDHLSQQVDSDLSGNGTDHRECGLSRSTDLSLATSSHSDIDRAYSRYGVSPSMLSQLDQHLSCQHHSDHVSSPKNDMHHAIATPTVTHVDGLGQADAMSNGVSDAGRDMEHAVSAHHDHSLSSVTSSLVCYENRDFVNVILNLRFVQEHDQFHSCEGSKGHNGMGMSSISSGHVQHFHHLSSPFLSGSGPQNLQQQVGVDCGLNSVQSLGDGAGVQSRPHGLVDVNCNGSFGQQAPWQGMGGTTGLAIPQDYLGNIFVLLCGVLCLI